MGSKTILRLIFTCNIFKYKDFAFLQQIGLPMGCICGSAIANIYIYILEREWISLNPDKIYVRYLDDIFIALPTLVNLNFLKTYFLYLKLNIETSSYVIFLDLEKSSDFILKKF